MRILYLTKENVTCGRSRWCDGLYASPNITGEIGSGKWGVRAYCTVEGREK